jgi:predicted ATPase
MSWKTVMDASEAAKALMLSDRQAGEKKFNLLLRRHSGDGMVYYQMGVAYESLGEYALAEENLQKAFKLFPKTGWKNDAKEAWERVRYAAQQISRIAGNGKIGTKRPQVHKIPLDETKGHLPMVVQSIHIQNLLSFGLDHPSLELRPLNVLIGPNGSGKSNLIEILGLVQSTSRDLLAPIRSGGGISEWLWKGNTERRPRAYHPTASIEIVVHPAMRPKRLRYKLAFMQTGPMLDIVEEKIEDVPYEGKRNRHHLYYEFDHGRAIVGTRGRKRILDDINPKQSILSRLKEPDQYPEITDLGQIFNKFALYRDWEFGINSRSRQIHTPNQQSEYLEEDASNLALVLSRMKNLPPTKVQLIQFLKEFYPEAEDINISIKEGLIDLRLEEQGGFTTPAARMSDGTLRWLSLLAVLLNPTPPPLVCIEEPELGLHPDIIPTLVRLLIEASLRMQIIITTHSDALVEELTETPESVIVCEKHNDATVLRRLQQKELSKWLSEYSLGQLWRKGEIGGTRW